MSKFYNPRNYKILFILPAIIGLTSCSENTKETVAPTGNEMFWTKQSLASSHIAVVIDGSITGNITKAFDQDTPPACGTLGCFTQVLSALENGTHHYTATDETHNWAGDFTITNDNNQHCNSIVLTY